MEIIWLMLFVVAIKEVWSDESLPGAIQPNGIHQQIRDLRNSLSQKGIRPQPVESKNIHNALPVQQDDQVVLNNPRRKRKRKTNFRESVPNLISNDVKQDFLHRPGDDRKVPQLPVGNVNSNNANIPSNNQLDVNLQAAYHNAHGNKRSQKSDNKLVHADLENARRLENSHSQNLNLVQTNDINSLNSDVGQNNPSLNNANIQNNNRVKNVNVPSNNNLNDENAANQNVIRDNTAHHHVDSNLHGAQADHQIVNNDMNARQNRFVNDGRHDFVDQNDRVENMGRHHRQHDSTQKPSESAVVAQPIDHGYRHDDTVANQQFNDVNVQNNEQVVDSRNNPDSRNPPNFMKGPDGVLRPVDFSDVIQQPSLKITWDWSDFSLNFDQYVIPEQKNRRAPHSSIGEPWPLPQFYTVKPHTMYRLSKEFSFIISKVSCDIIQEAVLRYKAIILEQSMQELYDNLQNAEGTPFKEPFSKYTKEPYISAPTISKVYVKIKRKCRRFPSLEMDESYDLVIKKNKTYIWSNEVWGALRGLETFSQLIMSAPNGQLFIKDSIISDYPRFRHRGILLDSSRHFIFKSLIYDVLEAMAQNKMNVLHWHIVDDQSFPYESKVFPELSKKGAYHPTFVYTHKDIADIIEFARKRGIRVLPEFDTPGHTYSWTLSHPEISTQCYDGGRPVKGYRGPLNPVLNSTYDFLRKLFAEVVDVFPEKFIHLGGDEVPMSCWYSNPEVMQFAKNFEQSAPSVYSSNQNQYTYNNQYDSSVDMKRVLEYYENRMIRDIREEAKKKKKDSQFIMWQEVMNNNLKLPNDSIIQIWQGDMSDVQRAIDMGYQALYSSCWYLDLIEYGVKWSKYYNCDPTDSSFGYDINEKKVLGGEACIWAEYIDNENLVSTLWPRASLAAERLWSSKDVKDIEAAAPRLQEHRCRMLGRGLQVGQISGPDYCLYRGKKLYLKPLQESKGNIEEIENVHIEVKKSLECSSALFESNSVILLVVIFLLVLMVMVSLKRSNGRITQIRVCRNKTIIIVFMTFLLFYLLCYTTLWVKVFDFSKTFHRKTS